jgi:hypothetical protein
MHALQIIKSKSHFIVLETMFGVTSIYPTIEPMEDMARVLQCNGLRCNDNVTWLPTITVNNAELKRIANATKLNIAH